MKKKEQAKNPARNNKALLKKSPSFLKKLKRIINAQELKANNPKSSFVNTVIDAITPLSNMNNLLWRLDKKIATTRNKAAKLLYQGWVNSSK